MDVMVSRNLSLKVIAFLGSRRFFYLILGLFILQALWFVFSAQYPMAFDENFHFGLIKVYSHQWGPIISVAPPGTGELGGLTREASYFFHYLMSFPYRIIQLFTANQEAQIIVLRLLNVAMFTAGIVLFRKLFTKIKASPALSNFALFIFIFIPIVPMLAAHINYDNLLFLLIPIILLVAMQASIKLQKNHLPVADISLLFILCLLTSIVKYAFLPIFAGLGCYFLSLLFLKKKRQWATLFHEIPQGFRTIDMKFKVLLVLGLLVSGGLFLERYGINELQYHSLVPDCGKVLSFEHCSQYGPWIRNFELAQNNTDPHLPNPGMYALDWINGMMHRLFFAINHEYITQVQLPLPITAGYFVLVSGFIVVTSQVRKLFRRYPATILFFLVIGFYTAVITGRNYLGYEKLGEMVAINGRYFIPLMPIIFISLGLSFKLFIEKYKHSTTVKTTLAVLAIGFFLQGGGVMTYILRSDPSWHWQDPTVIQINDSAQKLLRPIIFEGSSK